MPQLKPEIRMSVWQEIRTPLYWLMIVSLAGNIGMQSIAMLRGETTARSLARPNEWSPSQMRQTKSLSIVGGVGLEIVRCAVFSFLRRTFASVSRGAGSAACVLCAFVHDLLVAHCTISQGLRDRRVIQRRLAVRGIMLATMFLAAVTTILDW
jgi:hypothetical protein